MIADLESCDQAMVFFTDDNALILGLAVTLCKAEDFNRELLQFASTTHLFLGSEQPPPRNSMEFIAMCTGRSPNG